MLETLSSQRIEPMRLPVLGSSSADGEGTDFLFAENLIAKNICHFGQYFSFDVSSRFPATLAFLETETFGQKEEDYFTMIEHDFFIKMPPKKRRAVKFKILHIRKAKPKIVIPEDFYTDV